MILMAGGIKGILALLTLKARGIELVCVPYGKDVEHVCRILQIRTMQSVNSKQKYYNSSEDVLLSVHGREIVDRNILDAKRVAVNIHPYLYAYKGKDPVERAWADKNMSATVGMHEMTEEVDGGLVIRELCLDVTGSKDANDIKYRLNPLYVEMVDYFVDEYIPGGS